MIGHHDKELEGGTGGFNRSIALVQPHCPASQVHSAIRLRRGPARKDQSEGVTGHV